MSNAFKYTSDKGNIILSGEITNSDIKINITDTGIGISEQDKDKIFARFFQADNQEKKGSLFSGTGIGLALTRTIVEKHHGEITVKSVVGEGSTFTVRLPRRKDVFLNDKNVQFYTQDSESDIIPDSMPVFVDEGNSPIELIETKDTENKTHTVLLVEDNDELLQVLKELFEPFYKIICAHDGKEGLSQIYENSPDLVISDVMMPEMTGTEMCLQIKNNIDLCHIPVILLTALNSTEQNIEGLSRGADDYITKPFSMEELVLRVEAILRRVRGKKNKESTLYHIGKFTFDTQKQLLSAGEKQTKLTTKENELLALLCSHANEILQRDFALKTIWIDDNYFNARSMDVYITKLRKHLKDDPQIEIINIHGKGYKLITPNEE